MKPFVAAISLLLVYAGIFVYLSRYELGLVKPIFKVGDCVQYTAPDEFNPHTFIRKIVKVGQKNYLTFSWLSGSTYPPLFYTKEGDTQSFRYIDENFHKIECPDGS